MPEEILDIAQQLLTNPVTILTRPEYLADVLKHYYIPVEKEENKFDTLIELYESVAVTQCVIFVNSKKKVIQLKEDLAHQNHTVCGIHGAMDMTERNQIMRDFRDGRSRILVTTDLLARAIHSPQVSLVVNYDLPSEKEAYLNRLCCAGGFGRKGIAVNFVTDDDAERLQEIQQFYSTPIYKLPSNIKELLM